MAFILFISFLIILRIAELFLSKRNEKWLLQNGAVEYGQSHYPFMIALHVLFFVSLIIEYIVKQPASYHLFFIIFYLALLGVKLWVLKSLGKFWSTKIYRIASFKPITTGAYRYFKHPNYFIVILEIAIIPIAFNLFFTALVFSILNGIMLYVRIREENKVLEI